MPKMVSEVTSGVQYDFSAEEGQIAASTTRVFKILKSDASEYISIASACGIQVGQEHPTERGLYCVSYSAQYDGDSRMVVIATFNYRASPGLGGSQEDRKEQPPDVRPANWSVATSIQETPAYVWKGITGPRAGQTGPCVNPAGDLYEGVVRLEPIVTISIDQYESSDPTRHCLYAGYVNSNSIKLGSLTMFARSVMLRGVQTQPVVEHWGEKIYRGWKASYEFAFRVNWVGAPYNVAIGWDILQPQSGFNVKAWTPNFVPADTDNYSQPLKHENYAIKEPLSLPDGISAGQKVRSMIRVHESESGKTSQRPSAQPIPLNDDGSGRSDSASPPVIVHRYQVQNDIDFSFFGLRLI
jgi:hypothetical protein